MRLVEWRPSIRHPQRRCYLLGKLRIHHGLTGVLLILLGALLVHQDWADRWWLHDDR